MKVQFCFFSLLHNQLQWLWLVKDAKCFGLFRETSKAGLAATHPNWQNIYNWHAPSGGMLGESTCMCMI